ncbi:MAG: type III pantothenate kinase [Deinococcales bacterium]
MLLAIDVGNTSTVLGMYRDDELVASWRVATDRRRMSDEYAVLLGRLLELEGLEPPSEAILSSVVPPVGPELSDALSRYWGVRARLVTAELVAPLLVVDTDNPREVGADRMVNAVAALDYEGEAFIVVDFGTATNFDVVVRPNRLLGVALAPGPGVAAEALFAHAAKLPRVDLVAPEHAIGRNTVSALQSGLVFGYASMVDGMVERLAAEIEEEHGRPVVIATGGFTEVVRPHAKHIDISDPRLTLRGLRLLAERA